MLFPLKTREEYNLEESENAQNIALMKAYLLMDIYFDILKVAITLKE